MKQIKRLERLEEQLLMFETEVLPENRAEFEEFVLEWENTRERFRKLYLEVKIKFPDHPTVRNIGDRYWDAWDLPPPAYESRYEYGL